MRTRFTIPGECSVLEVGCGFGANIPYLCTLGHYHGIDGSQTAVDDNRMRFPDLARRLRTADFTRDLAFDFTFDVICDRGAITHNSDRDIRACVSLIRQQLRQGGVFVGVVWFSKVHSAYATAPARLDEYTCDGFTNGPFAGVGLVHFTDEQNLRDVFADFDILHLEHRVSTLLAPNPGRVNAYYNFVATRRR